MLAMSGWVRRVCAIMEKVGHTPNGRGINKGFSSMGRTERQGGLRRYTAWRGSVGESFRDLPDDLELSLVPVSRGISRMY
jgi:hypothetical protein